MSFIINIPYEDWYKYIYIVASEGNLNTVPSTKSTNISISNSNITYNIKGDYTYKYITDLNISYLSTSTQNETANQWESTQGIPVILSEKLKINISFKKFKTLYNNTFDLNLFFNGKFTIYSTPTTETYNNEIYSNFVTSNSGNNPVEIGINQFTSTEANFNNLSLPITCYISGFSDTSG